MQKHTCKTNQHKRKAFTIIELLIVIAIIGILFIVLISKVDFATDKAKATGVQTDFRSFQLAFNTVARENQGFNELIDGANYTQLESAINRNLDNKLKISIDETGKITMRNGAKDPWGIEYHGQYVTGTDEKDRGAIVVYSNGADMTFGSEISITGGVTSVSVVDDVGKDDYSLVSCYSLTDGYGKINNSSSGFDSNQGVITNNDNNDNNDSIEPGESIDSVVSIPYETREPGLYETGTNNLLYSWQALLDLNIVTSDGRGRGSDTSYGNPKGPDKDVVDFLSGDLQYPDYISKVPRYAFSGCTKLTGVILTSGTTILDDYAFGSLQKIEMFRVYGIKKYNSALYRTAPNGFYFDNVDSLFGLECMSSPWLNDFYAENGMGENTKI